MISSGSAVSLAACAWTGAAGSANAALVAKSAHLSFCPNFMTLTPHRCFYALFQRASLIKENMRSFFYICKRIFAQV
jgi:hypothetical protein